jgi:hypothetical protein
MDQEIVISVKQYCIYVVNKPRFKSLLLKAPWRRLSVVIAYLCLKEGKPFFGRFS